MDKNGAIYINIRGLYPKTDQSKIPYLSDLAQQTNAPFICVTESHLNPSILDAEISIAGYDLFRSDRKDRSHGGVAIYVRKDLAVKASIQDSNTYCDSLILHIPQLNLVLMNVYRPPNCPEVLFNQTMEHNANFLRNLEEGHQCANTYLLMGDFNFPFLKAGIQETNLNEISNGNTSSERKQARTLISFANEFFMEQYIKKPTRNKNILDLVFTNDHFLIHNYNIIVNSSLSDHFTIIINLNLKKSDSLKSQEQINHYFSKISELDLKEADEEDWYRLNLLFNKINWDSSLEELSTEESVQKFINLLEENASLVFKKKKRFQAEDEAGNNQASFKSNNKIPKPVRRLMRSKTKLSKAILKVKSCQKYLKMRESLEAIEIKLKDSYTSRRLEKEKIAISKMKRDPKTFFSYAKKFSRIHSDVGPFLDETGNLITNPEVIVDMLKLQYESVYSKPLESMNVEDPSNFFKLDDDAEEQLDNAVFNRSDILEAIEKLSANSAPGPDGIPSLFLKKCKYSLADALVIIFQKIFSSGEIPDILKAAFVIPVHKGGSKASPVNFRPVSLTSHLIKTLERVIRVILVRHLEINNKLNPNQHGFRSQRSCLSQLLEHHDEILSHLEDGKNVDSIYLDFSKAFDKVDIGILCHKLRALGITGKLGRWIHNFLTNRKQFILVNGTISKVSHVTSGVPQGTVLGPILFLIMINDINKDVSNSKVSLFADDTRVMKSISSEEDVEDLQSDLDVIYSWQKENNMLFNSNKFEMMRYGSNEELKISTNYLTPDCEDFIEIKESLRDLGVMMNDKGTFTNHIKHVCSKVKQKSSWILRTFQTRDSQFMKFMWKTLIQGHIDYCSQLYLPTQTSDLQQIENLQKCYTKKIPSIRHLNYWDRLRALKMNSLERRLERYRIIYSWKILEGLAPNCGLEEVCSERRGREIKIPQLKGKQAVRIMREQSFQVNGPRLFNCIPKRIRNMSKVSVDKFKEHLDKFLETVPDEPNVAGLTPATCNQHTAAPSNSILDQVRRVSLNRRPGA